MNETDITIIDNVSADTLEVGDQAIIEGDYVIIRSIHDTDDIDEIVVKVENLSDPTETEFSLFADDYYDIWAL